MTEGRGPVELLEIVITEHAGEERDEDHPERDPDIDREPAREQPVRRERLRRGARASERTTTSGSLLGLRSPVMPLF